MSKYRQPWERVEALLENKGFNETCKNCEFYREQWQHVPAPFGAGTVTEDISECTCMVSSDCPRLNGEDESVNH